MANELDELKDEAMEKGNDIKVIGKQLPVTVGTGSKIFDCIWWALPPVVGGVIWLIAKRNAQNYLSQLQQRIQSAASTVDNYLEQRVQILSNCAKLLDKAIDLDKETFTKLAAYRSKMNTETDFNAKAEVLSAAEKAINVAFESYPNLKAHEEIADAMQQNSYLQKEITAAREQYNDVVNLWNTKIFEWPTKQIVAAKNGFTTRIPFAADAQTKAAARKEFF